MLFTSACKVNKYFKQEIIFAYFFNHKHYKAKESDPNGSLSINISGLLPNYLRITLTVRNSRPSRVTLTK